MSKAVLLCIYVKRCFYSSGSWGALKAPSCVISCTQTQLPSRSCIQGLRWVIHFYCPVSPCHSSSISILLGWTILRFCCAEQTGSSAEPPSFPSFLLHLIFSTVHHRRFITLYHFPPKSVGKGGELFLGPDRGPQGGGEGLGRVLWGKKRRKEGKWWGLRLGLKNVTRVNASVEEKRMSIIDSDDPSRMAVFPRGETVSGSQPESPLWGKGQRTRWRRGGGGRPAL